METPRILRACDYCFAKKTRCNRKLPCDNCLAAKINCLRQRPKQTTKNNKNDRLDQVLERMARLEDCIKSPSESTTRQSQAPRAHPLSPQASLSRSPDASVVFSKRPPTVDTEQPRIKRQRVHSQPTENISRQNKALASLDLQRYFKLSRPRNFDVDTEQQNVLESAVSLAKQTMAECRSHEDTDNDSRVDLYDRTMYPTAEFLHLLLRENSQDELTAHFMRMFGVCDQVWLEDMIQQLLSGQAHGQQRVRYIICVNHAAYAYLSYSKSSQSPAMVQELMYSRTRYKNNALAGVRNLDATAQPSESLLFALHCASTLMQDLGFMHMCWKFNVAACKVAAALRSQAPPQTDMSHGKDLSHLRIVFLRCYILDTSLSANLYQPACLDDLELDPSILHSDRTSDVVLGIMSSYAQIHEGIIHETRKYVNPSQSNQMDTRHLLGLKERMLDIQSATDEVRSKFMSTRKNWLQFELLNLEFVFHSTMTSIIRLSARADDTPSYQECLDKARNSLLSLNALLEIYSSTDHPKPYLSSLAR
ncbi:hypothetical protein FALCPG4_008657 [Fusarium falciforme]